MAQFVENKEQVTSTPTVQVDGLGVGSHQFALVVEDVSGRLSQPAIVTVRVLPPKAPPRPDGGGVPPKLT